MKINLLGEIKPIDSTISIKSSNVLYDTYNTQFIKIIASLTRTIENEILINNSKNIFLINQILQYINNFHSSTDISKSIITQITHCIMNTIKKVKNNYDIHEYNTEKYIENLIEFKSYIIKYIREIFDTINTDEKCRKCDEYRKCEECKKYEICHNAINDLINFVQLYLVDVRIINYVTTNIDNLIQNQENTIIHNILNICHIKWISISSVVVHGFSKYIIGVCNILDIVKIDINLNEIAIKYKYVCDIINNFLYITAEFDTVFKSFVNNIPNIEFLISTKINSLMVDNKFNIDLITVYIEFSKYIKNLDVYSNQMSTYMMRRLISNNSFDNEQDLISTLKCHLNCQYIQKMKNIINSAYVWNTESEEWKLINNSNTQICNIKVVPRYMWYSEISSCNIPSIVKPMFDDFATYYINKYSHRKLSVNTELSTFTLDRIFHNKKYIFNVSMNIGSILLAIDNGIKTVRDIHFHTLVNINNLKSYLNTLIKKYNLLVCIRKSDDDDLSEYEINEKFSSNKIKINIILTKSLIQKVNHIKEKTIEDRRYQIESTIMRIMKSRKEIKHVDLITETINLLSNYFVPVIPIVKKSIEHLIDNEYIERENNYTYKYIA